jgi:hypothetical protein
LTVGTPFQNASFEDKQKYAKDVVSKFILQMTNWVTDKLNKRVGLWQDAVGVYHIPFSAPSKMVF